MRYILPEYSSISGVWLEYLILWGWPYFPFSFKAFQKWKFWLSKYYGMIYAILYLCKFPLDWNELVISMILRKCCRITAFNLNQKLLEPFVWSRIRQVSKSCKKSPGSLCLLAWELHWSSSPCSLPELHCVDVCAPCCILLILTFSQGLPGLTSELRCQYGLVGLTCEADPRTSTACTRRS